MPRLNFRVKDFSRTGDKSTATRSFKGITVTATFYHTKYGYLTLEVQKGKGVISWANEFCGKTLIEAVKVANSVSTYALTTGYVNHGIWDLDSGREFIPVTKAQKARNKVHELAYFKRTGISGVNVNFSRKWH